MIAVPRSRISGSARQRGFTLIEIMMVVVIIGILTAVALPSYRNYVIRGNRTAAEAAMMDIGNREQQFLLANRSYAATAVALGYTLPADISINYSLAIDIATGCTGTVPCFTITLTAIGNQVSDGPLTLTDQGVKSPADKW